MIKKYKNILKQARKGYLVDVLKIRISKNWYIYVNAELDHEKNSDKVLFYLGIMQQNKPIDKTFCKTFRMFTV